MRLALAQAEKGLGRTSPNPCVGAVIVRDGIVVGQGYHKKAGTPHAEINAIADAGSSCDGATIYVTLEPCNHTGRTPPCSRAVLAAGLRRVVIGMADPNPVARGG
ncbi:MAG TPA: bifunctional diaminohydroxyphosphoribosylaminopyrimidine deaminase/5-amino-6-(5-phosphoribosylamino)uracil reductase RibD, partial [Desulfobulbaceae bacterium]|nr:bifunctional diaminohydroxyphosphoribosylaminopyrimidine deaminase/5-amino-6-(5-phosphoribosylamino)uracil reductase RibD [Desulfobulbaceae bacterium]